MIQVVKIWAKWCNPCTVYQKHWDKYIANNEDTSIEFISVDVDSPEATEWHLKLTIKSIPMTAVLIDGEVVQTENGILKEQQLKDLIYGEIHPKASNSEN